MMIRINLLAEKPKIQPSRFTLDESKKIAIGGGLLLVVAAGYIGWSAWSSSTFWNTV